MTSNCQIVTDAFASWAAKDQTMGCVHRPEGDK